MTSKINFFDAFGELEAEHDRAYETMAGLIEGSVPGFNRVPFWVGQPGLGKTESIRLIVGELNQASGNRYALLSLVLGHYAYLTDLTGVSFPMTLDEKSCDLADLPGMEYTDRGVKIPLAVSVTTKPPLLLALEAAHAAGKKTVVFVDEVTNIGQEHESFFLKLAEMYLGTWRLPDSVALVAAGNPHEISVAQREFSPAMNARLIPLPFRPSFRKWAAWMLSDPRINARPAQAFWNQAVVSYLRTHPRDFCPSSATDYEPEEIIKSPRNWTDLAKTLGALASTRGQFFDQPENIRWVVSRAFTKDITARFMTFYGSMQMPTGRDILLGKAEVPGRLGNDGAFILAGSVCAALQSIILTEDARLHGPALENFGRFIEQLERREGQKADSVMMPYMKGLVELGRHIVRQRRHGVQLPYEFLSLLGSLHEGVTGYPLDLAPGGKPSPSAAVARPGGGPTLNRFSMSR